MEWALEYFMLCSSGKMSYSYVNVKLKLYFCDGNIDDINDADDDVDLLLHGCSHREGRGQGSLPPSALPIKVT